MDWKTILMLSLGGAVMGLLASFVGFRAQYEFILWILIFAGWLWYLVTRDVARPVLVATIAGLLAGLWAGSLETLFLDAYTASNPWYAAEMPATTAEAAQGLIPFGSVVGLVFGAGTGLLAAFLQGKKQSNVA